MRTMAVVVVRRRQEQKKKWQLQRQVLVRRRCRSWSGWRFEEIRRVSSRFFPAAFAPFAGGAFAVLGLRFAGAVAAVAARCRRFHNWVSNVIGEGCTLGRSVQA